MPNGSKHKEGAYYLDLQKQKLHFKDWFIFDFSLYNKIRILFSQDFWLSDYLERKWVSLITGYIDSW